MRSNKMANECSGRRNQSDDLKDEVYRQMFRLEAGRPGAASQLAVALLRAWIELEGSPKPASGRVWLRKICPICIGLLEASRDPSQPRRDCQHLI
jgi:hypothetical protein